MIGGQKNAERSGQDFRWLLAVLVACLAGLPWAFVPDARAGGLASHWVEGHKNRARLSAGAVDGASPGTVTAFVEILMDKGWKTYWRNPGTAGGIPPAIDWARSSNVASAEILYPVPEIMSDKAGDVIGYKEHVTFPLRITPKDPAEPLALDLTVSYGICEKLCVPAEASFKLTVPPGAIPAASADAAAAYAAVPRKAPNLRPGDPSDFSVERRPQASGAALILKARFPGAVEAAAMFLDAGDGRYLPLPRRTSTDGETVTFEAAIESAEDLAQVKGATVVAVLKGAGGQSEHTFVID